MVLHVVVFCLVFGIFGGFFVVGFFGGLWECLFLGLLLFLVCCIGVSFLFLFVFCLVLLGFFFFFGGCFSQL